MHYLSLQVSANLTVDTFQLRRLCLKTLCLNCKQFETDTWKSPSASRRPHDEITHSPKALNWNRDGEEKLEADQDRQTDWLTGLYPCHCNARPEGAFEFESLDLKFSTWSWWALGKHLNYVDCKVLVALVHSYANLSVSDEFEWVPWIGLGLYLDLIWVWKCACRRNQV